MSPQPIAAGGADELAHLRLHQPAADPGERLAEEVESLLVVEQVPDDPSAVILFVSAIVVLLSSIRGWNRRV